MLRIALIGDYNAEVIAHQAIPKALQLSAARLGVEVVPQWIHTTTISQTAEELSGYSALWCVPASPYANTEGALAAIRIARENKKPFLGTCGGFQHAVLEYARNVLGYAQADHAENSPETAMPVIAQLSCSLVEKGDDIFLREETRIRAIYGADRTEEMYHCSYGVNPKYATLLDTPIGLRISANDAAGEVGAVELVDHPFFVATLFQPERSGLRGIEHPLITAFVAAAE